jgi:hypothetical protein
MEAKRIGMKKIGVSKPTRISEWIQRTHIRNDRMPKKLAESAVKPRHVNHLPESFISKSKAARILGVSPKTLGLLAVRNKVRTKRIAGHPRTWFSQSDILALINPPQNIAG